MSVLGALGVELGCRAYFGGGFHLRNGYLSTWCVVYNLASIFNAYIRDRELKERSSWQYSESVHLPIHTCTVVHTYKCSEQIKGVNFGPTIVQM